MEREEIAQASDPDLDRGLPDDPAVYGPSIIQMLGGDLSRLTDILPQETRLHLKNAGTEAILALFHLWKSVDAVTGANKTPRPRKHIDVE